MSELTLNGRLGMETINKARGCCVASMLKWSPRMVGDKHKCMYCDNTLKAIRAGEFSGNLWNGSMNETTKDTTEPPFTVNSIWFLRSIHTVDSAKSWLSDHGLYKDDLSEDEFAITSEQEEVVPESERFVFADKGVLAVVGVQKMDTGDMGSGGLANPTQGADDFIAEEEDIDAGGDELAAFDEVGEKCSKGWEANFEKSLNRVVNSGRIVTS